jgi:hypothetical protein
LPLGVFVLIARDAWSITISPSPSYTGNYTVTFASTGCYTELRYYPAYVFQVCKTLQQRAGAGAWINVSTAYGATSLNVTGKAPGTYAYQVYQTSTFGGYQVIDGPASVTVGTAPPRDPLVTQLGYQFQTRKGDINADGRTDLFVKRTVGGVAGNGVLDAAILRQSSSGGLFSVTAPTAYESSLASTWPLSSASVVVTDFNVDGFVDVEVKGVAAATGVPTASDQIVFSSGIPFQPQPLGVRAVDAALKRFVGNTLDYMVNPDYFSENADLRFFVGTYPVYFCRAPLGAYSGILDRYDNGFGCSIYNIHVSGYYWDYREFSSAAVDTWLNEAAFWAGATTQDSALSAIEETFEQVLGVIVGGWDVREVAGPNGPYSDLDHRRGLNAFLVLLGIAEANAQQIETKDAPKPVPREPNVIYVVGRYVFAAAERGIHSALQYTTSGLTAPSWLSAFDSEAESGVDDGTLLAETNDPRDHPMLTRLTLGWVIPPNNGPRATYWFNEVVPAHDYYKRLPLAQKAPYDAIPEIPCFAICSDYNSNSYVQGLVEATRGRIVAMAPFLEDFDDLVGGGSPVPASYFGR